MVTIERISGEAYDLAGPLVTRLLSELREGGDDSGPQDTQRIKRAWQETKNTVTLIARSDNGEAIGVATVVENFAIYADGHYGVINELYVVPEYRSQRVGEMLLEAIRDLGKERNWKRIDVTAPGGDKWERTRAFYERHGYVFTGPKLKLVL
jgi:GNAT superfamily N-acetyltransferase